ncbi:trigger factor [Psychroflexus planctonicus]|uniref:Trigger factor n=1 Tax=Psychroflexus planctonicus TaxID=1526575 RepID=A0ABQ1SJM1_9FLAO|nr:trigger factor [Psychroflexus planctonicus]GGE38681.1 peptidylprolyl isomerase [Psychroflexus planctonicus]
MQITKENSDNLNAVVKVNIDKSDYSEKVDKILKDYRKTANIPGFRKGHVPMGMIKRQYGQAVLADEVNKLIQESLNNYLTEEKLDILGNPIPKEQEDFSWDSDDYSFEFELGLAPEINIDFNNKKAITHYKISADKEMIDDQIKLIQRQFGKLVSQTEVKEGFTLVGKFTNEEEGIENETSFKLEDLKGKKNKTSFLGAKTGDTIQVNTKGLFEKEEQLATFLGLEEDKAKDLDVDVNFEITEINEEVPHELNQELFDKYTREEGKITSEEELKNFIKEQAAEQFVQHSDQQLLNDTTEYLLESTKFDLPTEFLQKWIQISGEKELTKEEAKEEFEKSEKGIRYQLIEAKIIKDNDIQVKPEEVKDMMKERIKMQMAQYGGASFSDEQMDQFANQMLSNQEEARKISEQVMSGKILDLLKEKLKLKEKEVSFKKFADEVYK